MYKNKYFILYKNNIYKYIYLRSVDNRCYQDSHDDAAHIYRNRIRKKYS